MKTRLVLTILSAMAMLFATTGAGAASMGTLQDTSTGPTIVSILRMDANPTAADRVSFAVTFSTDVYDVDMSDFVIYYYGLTGPNIGIYTWTGSGANWVVTVDTGSGSGFLRLEIHPSATIYDIYGQPLATPLPYTDGEAYTINRGNPVFAASPKAWDYGTVKVGAASTAQTFTIKNGGTGALFISDPLSLKGPNAAEFQIDGTTCVPGTTLLPNAAYFLYASCTVTVTFRPISKGNKSAYIEILDNAAKSPQRIPLSGTGRSK